MITKSFLNKLFSGLKIRQKLVLVFLPIPLLAVILIGSLWYWNALNAVRTTLEEQTSILAQNASLLLEDFFKGRELEINSVTKLNWLESFFIQINRNKSNEVYRTYKERLRRLLVNLGSGYFQITCFGNQNQPFAKAQLTSSLPQEELPVHFETRLFTEQDRIGIPESASLGENEIYISDVRSIGGSEALVFGAAVFDSEQRIGTVTFSFTLSTIADEIKDYNLGIASQAMVVDEKGDLLHHTDRSKVNQNIRAAMPYLDHTIDAMLSLKKGTAKYRNNEDELWILSYSPVKKVRWSVGVASPVKPFIQSTEHAGLLGIVITVGISLLLLVLINLFSKRFVRDLSEVTEGAKVFATGDLDRQIPVRSQDEIGELAKDFNTMAAGLKRLMQERQTNQTLIAIGQFSATLAHDLRNPVEGLKLLSAELKKRVKPSQPAYEVADTISQSVKNLSSFINELLDFARLTRPNLIATDLSTLADEVLADFNFEQVELKRDYVGDLPLVEVDTAQIRRVLANLVGNALDACLADGKPTGRQISLTLKSIGEKVHIEVADTGTGIPLEARQKIFEPFFSTKPGGHGLGLALVRQIIANHGGTITFTSEVAQGTCFSIDLPIAQSRYSESLN